MIGKKTVAKYLATITICVSAAIAWLNSRG